MSEDVTVEVGDNATVEVESGGRSKLKVLGIFALLAGVLAAGAAVARRKLG